MPGDSSSSARVRLVGALALILGLFHLANVSGLLVLSTMIIRALHLTIMLTLVFLRPWDEGAAPLGSVQRYYRAGLWGASLLTGAYLLVRWDEIALSGGITTALDIVVAGVIIVLVLEATRQAVGNFLAVITVVFLLYPFVSPYLPGVLFGRGVRAESVVSFLSLTGQGIYGIPVGVASTYIILFTIFGAFLTEFGAGAFFFKLANSITRGLTAASAKTAVIFSTLLGMISGSAAGNVAVTGSFTIPMMKREGYQPHQAGAIEAVVSTGGQIMPPVMGAAAFIMAEIVGTAYVNIMRAGLMPALLFFTSVLFVVHLQALKSGLVPESDPGEGGDSLGATLLNGVPFVLPFISLVGMMIAGFSPVRASFYAILMVLLLHLAATRTLSRAFFVKVARATIAGVKSAVPISIACAAAGIISGILSITGLGSKLSIFIISLSGGIPLVGLVLTMFAAIILGMGLPTTASYLILATVVAPALTDMGVALLTAHMFVFFFGCVSTITPPVALASYVAAGVARADINQVGWTAFRYGLVCYLLPFAFFFGPALLSEGPAWEIATTALTGVVGVFFLATAIVGYLRGPLPLAGRIVVAAAGACLIDQGLVTDLAGLLAAGAWILADRRRP
ncbi:MAG: TRAP transporter fused permease subunit [Rhodospirillaceae bacterium]|nr:TRAP transporter fused permease subunit [Rhodospirillaceae bacterium]